MVWKVRHISSNLWVGEKAVSPVDFPSRSRRLRRRPKTRQAHYRRGTSAGRQAPPVHRVVWKELLLAHAKTSKLRGSQKVCKFKQMSDRLQFVACSNQRQTEFIGHQSPHRYEKAGTHCRQPAPAENEKI